MIIRTKVKLFWLLPILLIISLGVYLLLNSNSCPRISCINLKDSGQYKIKDVYEENKYIFRGLFENGSNLLKTEVRSQTTQDEANQAIQVQITRTKGVFEDAAAPYPGEISDIISCDNAYKPVYSQRKQNGMNISFFEGYVNERLVFGSCVDDQAAYHDTLAMFYCSNQKRFYQVEVIIPRKDYINNKQENDLILNSLGCK